MAFLVFAVLLFLGKAWASGFHIPLALHKISCWGILYNCVERDDLLSREFGMEWDRVGIRVNTADKTAYRHLQSTFDK